MQIAKHKFFHFSWHRLAIILIVALALFLRFYQLDKSVWMQSGYDESRDMLVAKHIVLHKEHVAYGPLAAGGMNWLKNSPVYYYFIAVLWSVTREPVLLMYLWAALMTIPVIFAYYIGKKFQDHLAGIILASFFAVNSQLLYGSRELLQPHLLIICATIFSWSLISNLISKHKYRILHLFSASFFLFIPLHFHYGVLIAMPAAATLLGLRAWAHYRNSRQLLSLIILIAFTAYLIWTWVLATYRSFPFDQIYFLSKNRERNYEPNPLEQLGLTMEKINHMLWGETNWIHIIVGALLVLSAVLIVLRKTANDTQKTILSWYMLVSSSALLFIFYKHYVAETYLLYLFPFILISMALILRKIIERFRIGGSILSVFIIGWMLQFSWTHTLAYLPTVSYHDQQRQLAEIIAADYRQQDLDLNNRYPELLITWYTTTYNMPFDGWGSSGIWYYLEDIFAQKLVINTSYGLNHTPLYKRPKLVYMICDHRSRAELVPTECEARFLKSYVIKTNSFVKIKTGENLSLWRATIDNPNNREIRNTVHQDMMK